MMTFIRKIASRIAQVLPRFQDRWLLVLFGAATWMWKEVGDKVDHQFFDGAGDVWPAWIALYAAMALPAALYIDRRTKKQDGLRSPH